MSNLTTVDSIRQQLEALGLDPDSISPEEIAATETSGSQSSYNSFTRFDQGGLPIYYLKTIKDGAFEIYREYTCKEDSLIEFPARYRGFRGVVLHMEFSARLDDGSISDGTSKRVCQLGGVIGSDGTLLKKLPDQPITNMFGWDDDAKKFDETLPSWAVQGFKTFGVRANGQTIPCAECIKSGKAFISEEESIDGSRHSCTPDGRAWILVTELVRYKKDSKSETKEVIVDSVSKVKCVDEEEPIGPFILQTKLGRLHTKDYPDTNNGKNVGLASYNREIRNNKDLKNYMKVLRLHYTQFMVQECLIGSGKRPGYSAHWSEITTFANGSPLDVPEWKHVQDAGTYWAKMKPDSLTTPEVFSPSRPQPLITGAIEANVEDLNEVIDNVPDWVQ